MRERRILFFGSRECIGHCAVSIGSSNQKEGVCARFLYGKVAQILGNQVAVYGKITLANPGEVAIEAKLLILRQRNVSDGISIDIVVDDGGYLANNHPIC